ncbi:Uncharacterised protein [Mycobacteroides abscessus]|nr:Uncharacterised protein [Mycobacteroides abscessus]SIK68585.1 Uncharacterised protein [Mycobacteroides abscessus subsp. abscessus]SKT91774.1 Uncharacterised protein [Mycobacteroides abscessus subsp. abscessus]SKY31152.1 Uncharacterised protein [Mycobacteroides abscessus subsp. abscessus]
MIAGADTGHRLADRRDDSRALVTEDRGNRNLRLECQVRMTQAGGMNLDQHLVAAGFVELQLLQGERSRG